MLVALLAGGGFTLHGALTTGATPPPASLNTQDEPSPDQSVFAAATPGSSERASRDEPPPTLALRVTGECYVQVTTADGEVLLDETLTEGKRWSTDEAPLDVTVGDSGAVEIFVRGEAREQGGSGELEQFEVSGED